jgi:hypothetical protein
LIGLGKA